MSASPSTGSSFAIQDEISLAIVTALKGKLLTQDEAVIAVDLLARMQLRAAAIADGSLLDT